jgi:RNA polymerase sigma-70 factor, ECF subfamily
MYGGSMFFVINTDFKRNNEIESQDIDLVEKLKEKDVDSFEFLYKKYVNKIYTLAFRITQNQNIAEELTQDIFVRVWEKINSFKGNSSFFTWLYRLAINIILNDIRIHSNIYEKEVKVDDFTTFYDESVKSNIDTAIDIEKAIASLPLRAREVFILYDIEGFQHEEIAKLANISVGTSKSHLHRARYLLKEALKYEM